MTPGITQRGAQHPRAVRITAGKDVADLHATGGTVAVRSALAGARPGGLVYAEAHLVDHPPADTPEARVAAARAAAAHAVGLTLGHPADLPVVRQGVRRHFGVDTPTLYVQGDICRRELLVEIDGIAEFA